MRGSALGAFLATGLLACGGAGWIARPHAPVPERPASELSAVLLLAGDAGDAVREASPLLHKLRADVERWSRSLARDGSVAVAFLGDNVYPEGVRDPGGDGFASDSARLDAQVWTVRGPSARARGTRAIFLPGNHDWGNRAGPEGVARLRNMEALLARLADGGPRVEFVPRAGAPGPAVLELGGVARLLAIDTHWWLQAGDDSRKRRMLDELASLLGAADDRASAEGPTADAPRIDVLLAHHPIASGGPHGGSRAPLTPEWFLRHAGALVQDLNSAPYRSLREGLLEAFGRAGPPEVFAAGHDHTLQVHRGDEAGEPAWMLVSGAGSHVEPVDSVAGLVWTAPAAGYMTLLFGRDGGVDLHVVAATADVLDCPAGAASEACVREGVAAFRTVYSARLR